MRRLRGFTLVELMVASAVAIILAVAIITAINPVRQFSNARNTQRRSDVNVILNGVGQRLTDNRASWPTDADCAALPTAATTTIGTGLGKYDIYDCLVPLYISALPYDPSAGSFTDKTNYDLNYRIIKDANNRVVVDAPSAELSVTISVTR